MIFKSFYRILLIVVFAIVILLLVSYYRVLSVLKEDQVVRLPMFVGMDIIEANRILETINENLNKKISVRVIPVVQEGYPRYVVVKQEPGPRGIPIKEGRTINLQISVGNVSPFQMPNYIGKSFGLLREVLSENKDSHDAEKPAIGNVILRADKDIPKGYIISQTPLPGATILKDRKVDFIVSSGPYKEVLVADYLGRFAEPVIKYLSDKQIIVSIENKEVLSSEEDGKIISQDRKEGSILQEGDTIHFAVANHSDGDTDAIRGYSIVRFIIPSMLHPFFKNKKDNMVNITLSVSDDIGKTIIYKGRKRFGEQIIECYKKNGNGKLEIILDDREFKSFTF